MRRIGLFPRAARAVWWWLRQVSGDAAYENYFRWASEAPGGRVAGTQLSREEFYLDALARKYARVSRCC